METDQFLRDEYHTLREEIKATKGRLFWIVTLGLVGIPFLTHFAAQADFFARLLLPYSVLLLMVTFLAEQSSMMRAGRYIRERIETNNASRGWEGWIELDPHFRLADRHFVACFLIVFFLYYLITISMAVESIPREEAKLMTSQGRYWYWFYAGLVSYAIGAVWVLLTLFHHWKSTVSTLSEDGATQPGSEVIR